MATDSIPAETLLRRIQGSRRLKIRFPLRTMIHFDGPGMSGDGVTIDMSSSGVRFVADRSLPLGLHLRLALSWPVLLNGECPLRLIFDGRVVRTDGMIAACTIHAPEFRTAKRSHAAATISPISRP